MSSGKGHLLLSKPKLNLNIIRHKFELSKDIKGNIIYFKIYYYLWKENDGFKILLGLRFMYYDPFLIHRPFYRYLANNFSLLIGFTIGTDNYRNIYLKCKIWFWNVNCNMCKIWYHEANYVSGHWYGGDIVIPNPSWSIISGNK